MILTGNEPNDEPVLSTQEAAAPRHGRTRLRRAGLLVVALLGVGVLAAACGGGPSSPGVASLGKATATTGAKTAPSGSNAGDVALSYVGCMRTHGEPNMPEPTIAGHNAHISVS